MKRTLIIVAEIDTDNWPDWRVSAPDAINSILNKHLDVENAQIFLTYEGWDFVSTTDAFEWQNQVNFDDMLEAWKENQDREPIGYQVETNRGYVFDGRFDDIPEISSWIVFSKEDAEKIVQKIANDLEPKIVPYYEGDIEEYDVGEFDDYDWSLRY